MAKRWKARLKRAPVIGRLLRWSKLASPGGWIFSTRWLRWLERRDLRGQLPWSLRAFGAYVRLWLALLGTTRERRVPGAIQLFTLVSRLRRLAGRPETRTIRIDERRVALKLDDPRFLAVISEHVHPGAEIRAVLELLRPGDTFIDIGANHGSFAIAAAHAVGPEGAVLAFEPQADLAALVEQSLAHAPAGLKRTFGVALGEHRGEVSLWVPRDSSGAASVARPVDTAAILRPEKAPVDTLDHVLRDMSLPGRMVIKLDVEGYETAVLRGAVETLRAHQPAIVSEFFPDHIHAAGFDVDALCEALEQGGYIGFAPLGDPAAARPLSALSVRGERDVVLLPSGGPFAPTSPST